MNLLVNQGKLNGSLEVPSDKSISHRSLMFASIAHGTTKINNILRGEDCLSTLSVLKQLGVQIEDTGTTIIVEGKGIENFKQTEEVLNVGNSGTTIRLMLGILAACPFESKLSGDDSLNKRPMDRVLIPLSQMGASCSGIGKQKIPPITIKGSSTLASINYQMPVASAQVKSAILLAALHAQGVTTVIEKEPTRDHTEEMIRLFGGKIKVTDKTIQLSGPQRLIGTNITVPGDISSASFFIAAALLLSDSQITLENVGLNPTRTGILDVIKQMQGTVKIANQENQTLSGDVLVKSSTLVGTEIGGALIPRLIDELPIIALMATQANGTTVIRDAEELKVKETNRIDCVAKELTKLGANIEPTDDGMIIHGPTRLHGGKVSSHGDHRIGMMLAIAALVAKTGKVTLEDAQAINVSYPNFFKDINYLLGQKN